MKDQMDAQRLIKRNYSWMHKSFNKRTAIDQARIQKDYDIADKRAEVQYDKMTTSNFKSKREEMPLTNKGKKIMSAMKKEYGKEKRRTSILCF